MGALPSFLVILFLPPLLSGLCLQPRDMMTLPLHYWPVLSGDPSLLFLCHSLIVCCSSFDNLHWWQIISLGGLSWAHEIVVGYAPSNKSLPTRGSDSGSDCSLRPFICFTSYSCHKSDKTHFDFLHCHRSCVIGLTEPFREYKL